MADDQSRIILPSVTFLPSHIDTTGTLVARDDECRTMLREVLERLTRIELVLSGHVGTWPKAKGEESDADGDRFEKPHRV